MLKTILILLITVVVLPIVAFQFDQPLNDLQQQMLWESGGLMLGIALLCFVVAEITRNCSQTDKLWSITPILYTGYFAWASHWDPRITLMAALTLVWGARLTFNFSRRGGYSWRFWGGEEDYRWSVLRENDLFKGHPFRWTLFNLFFISLYQHALIWLFTLPALLCAEAMGQGLFWADYLLAALFLGLVLIETIADQQQWNYQTEKHRRKKAGEPLTQGYELGFTHTGLWAYVRHPNYAAEQSIWLVFYAFTIAATGRWMNWSLAGGLLLLILFQGSSDFSEKISLQKYPRYQDYLRKVGRFLPFNEPFKA
jgi:steroid 5-alpha reductase family enzyme